MSRETCRIDGLPLVHDYPDSKGNPIRKCLNEQVTHRYHWPDKTKNSGWVLITKPTEESK